MAQPGAYAPGPVLSPELIVRVNGVVRGVESVQWAGDTTGGLPEHVVTVGTGMKSRTGVIQWAGPPLLEGPWHPVRQEDGWPPREGDALVIDAVVDGVVFRRFTGRLGATTGSLIDGTLESEFTDMLGDHLKTLVTVPPEVVGPADYTQTYRQAYLAVERAGLGFLPAPDAHTILHNPGQGGASPVVGQRVYRFEGRHLIGYGSGYGGTTTDNLTTRAASSPRRGGRDVLIVSRGAERVDSTGLVVHMTSGKRLTLKIVPATNEMTLHLTAVGVIWRGRYEGDEPLPFLGLQILGANGFRVWVSQQRFLTVAEGYTLSREDTVDLAWTIRSYGVSVRFLPHFTDGAKIIRSMPTFPVGLFPSGLEQVRVRAIRGFENTTARQIVDEWSEATSASVWMDELGKPVMMGRDRLVSQSPVRTVIVDERVFAGAWSRGRDSVRSQVILRGVMPVISGGGAKPRQIVHQPGNIREIEAGEPVEEFVKVPDDEDWVGVDERFRPIADRRDGAVNFEDFNDRDGSFWQICWSSDKVEGDFYGSTGATFENVDGKLERLGQRAFKITHRVWGSPAPGSNPRYFLASPTGDAVYPQWRGTPMPILRADYLVAWADFVIRAGDGPSWAAPLELDVGWWLHPEDAQRAADALAAEVTSPMVNFSGLEVLWDPTRQIGDVETWVMRGVTSTGEPVETWRTRVLVTGYAESWESGVPSQTVDVRVISMTDPNGGKTYRDLAEAYQAYRDLRGAYRQVHESLPVKR